MEIELPDRVIAEKESSPAKVAYDMAMSLWWEEFGARPKASDAKFVGLVAACASALRANPLTNDSTVGVMTRLFPKG